jgi:5-methylcytosine-specific restriction endonuclease McrA
LISITRTNQPRALTRNGDRWLAKLKAIRSNSLTATKKQIDRATNKYRHPEIKAALVTMFHGKCAYRESKITVVTYGSIEHFRPKSKYIDDTFKWDNLLFSCDTCNNSGHKGDHFPLNDFGDPILLDPTDGTLHISDHLEFSWNPNSGLAAVYGRDDRGREVENMFDLNGLRGRKELIEHRSEHVKKLVVLLTIAGQNPDARNLLWEDCQPSAEYSAFARLLCADLFGL